MADEDRSTTAQRRRRESGESGGSPQGKTTPSGPKPPSNESSQEKPASGHPSKDSSDGRQSRTRQSRDPDSTMNPTAAAREAVRQLQELTQREVEGVVGIERSDDGGWTVTVEVVESRRIPDTADVLAEYEVGIDAEGGLTTYSRRSRYVRGRTSRE